MSTEATSALTFGDLILEIARKMGVAFYGTDGDEAAQIPENDHDLAECKRHANNAVRMFVADAPPRGWRWIREVSTVHLWADVVVDATKTVTGGAYDIDNDQTLITANSSAFYPSMEEKSIVVTGRGTFIIKRYVSATTVYVYGSHGFAVASTYSISAGGDFTLPRTFAGAFTGGLTFGASTNRAMRIEWIDEATIRQYRENIEVSTGTPRYIAVDSFTPTSGRKRFKVLAFPTPQELYTIQFPYDVHFDLMVDLDETPPTPIGHDETLKAACLAIVERDVHDMSGGPMMTEYLQRRLAASYQLDARLAPRKLGYFGNVNTPITLRNFRQFTERPTVEFNS